MGYINSAQQIFVEVYGLGAWFPAVFGCVAAALALGLLRQQPAGRPARDAADLACGADRLRGDRGGASRRSTAALGQPPLPLFVVLLALGLFCFGLIMPNFNAIAMEPMGRIAGTASSFVGAVTTGVAAGLGLCVGQQYRRQRAAAGRGVRGVRAAGSGSCSSPSAAAVPLRAPGRRPRGGVDACAD